MDTYPKELAFGREIVARAMTLCLKVQQRWRPEDGIIKEDRTPVTVADFAVQALIHLAIRREFPDAALVSEESADALRKDPSLRETVVTLVREHDDAATESDLLDAIDAGVADADGADRFWTLDPIDGTKGFLRGDQYAIALALIEGGDAKVGLLGCPSFPDETGRHRGALFYAVRGEGAYRADIAAGDVRIFVDDKERGEQAAFCESVEPGHANRDVHARIAEHLGITAPPFRMDSQAKYAALATGMASVYLRLPRNAEYREKIWDHAAGSILVEEAGGRVSDFDGNPLDFTTGRKLVRNVGILASNGLLHDAALRAIRLATDPEG